MPSIYFLPDDKSIEVGEDETILQASLRAGNPHTHVCGGKARCTTCRILVLDGIESCIAPRNDSENQLASQLNFAPMIRLACQTHATGNVKVRRLVLDDADVMLTQVSSDSSDISPAGMEKSVTILFADIRDFTSFSENQLPYDVIHLLNRYFHTMRAIIERHGGYIYNYMGDGLLALFGIDDASHAAEDGVRAGLKMLQAMEDMQPYIQNTYGHNLDIGVGIHCGEVVIGTIDNSLSGKKMVIGDAVNFASRIESANKDTGTRLLVSEPVYNIIRQNAKTGKTCSVTIKGKHGEYQLFEILSLT